MDQAVTAAQWVHSTPGRLRVKVAAIKRDPAAAAAAERRLRREPEIVDAVASPVTGSIVIHYDAQRTSPQTILGHLSRHGLPAAMPKPTPLEQISTELGRTLGKELLRLALAELLSIGPLEMLFALI